MIYGADALGLGISESCPARPFRCGRPPGRRDGPQASTRERRFSSSTARVGEVARLQALEEQRFERDVVYAQLARAADEIVETSTHAGSAWSG